MVCNLLAVHQNELLFLYLTTITKSVYKSVWTKLYGKSDKAASIMNTETQILYKNELEYVV